jgi:Flp pilus assembly pilin Flp
MKNLINYSLIISFIGLVIFTGYNMVKMFIETGFNF